MNRINSFYLFLEERKLDESELRKLIKMLRRLISGNYKPRIYKPKIRDLIYKPKGGGYRKSPSKYIMHHNFKYQPEPKPKIPADKPSSYRGSPWKEPVNYKPEKERLVYDPEVKQLLRSIDEHLAGSEENKLGEVSYESSEQEEASEIENFEVDAEIDLPEMQGNFEGSQIEIENEAEPLENMEMEEISGQAIVSKESLGLETEVEQFEPIEPQAEEMIPEEASVVQQLETEDLSTLEAELFPELTEPIERTEPVQESEYYG